MNAGRDWKDQLRELHTDSYAWSLFCCNQDEDMAKDALQMVYLKIYEGKARFLQQSALKSWLFSVIRNTAIDLLRENGTNRQALNETHNNIPDDRIAADAERQNQFQRILNSLSIQQREVLTLAFYHDLTLEEVAQAMSLSVGTVRTHYERGKENFRKRLVAKKDSELS